MILQTLRAALNDDDLWFRLIKAIHKTYERKTVTTKELLAFNNDFTQKDCSKFFEQYLYHPGIPTLMYRIDHSFEGLQNYPIAKNKKNAFEFEHLSGYIPFQRNLKYWKAASDATPDLRVIDKETYRRCQEVYKDCNKPRTGINVVGIMTYLENSNTDFFREYVQIKLKNTIKPGVKTYVELWAQKDRQARLVSNNIGFYFSQKKFYIESEEVIEKIPQVNHDSIINENEFGWVKIEGSFIPDKPMIYVTIGNFYNNKNTKLKKYKNFRGSSYTPSYAHYLIDDIRIWQEGDQPEPKIKKEKFEVNNIKKNQPITLENIFFDFDKATLQTVSYVELNKLFTFLQQNPSLKIKIQGHTDNRGNDDYNLKLSTNRAASVFNFLREKGIAVDRLTYVGYGESQPIDTNDTDIGRDKNRRVEFMIID